MQRGDVHHIIGYAHIDNKRAVGTVLCHLIGLRVPNEEPLSQCGDPDFPFLVLHNPIDFTTDGNSVFRNQGQGFKPVFLLVVQADATVCAHQQCACIQFGQGEDAVAVYHGMLYEVNPE